MALNAARYPLTRMAKRGLAAQAAVCPKEGSSPDITCTVLPNKLMVSTLDLDGALSRLSVAFRAGTRHETQKNLGIVHVIRSMTGFGTHKCSGFSIWKNTQQNGVHLYYTGDREVTGFHIVGARDKINDVFKFMSAAVSAPAFKSWEVQDNAPRLKYEIKGLSPQAKVIDNLHAAAFRTGLGNSLFIREARIGTYSSSQIESFYKEGFTANRASVSGFNLLHNDVLEFAKSLDLLANDLPEGNSTYYGGEMRSDVDSYFAHVAVATQGVGTKDVKEALAYCLLQHVYGIRPVISWGGSPSPLYKAIYSVSPDAGISCINVSYSDAGLFGFMVTSPAEVIGKVVPEALKVLKSCVVSEADFNRAKALVKANILFNSEITENVMEDMYSQSLQGAVIIPGPVLAEAVDKVTISDVSNVAKKVASGKFSISAYGDLTKLPYLDELQ